MASTYLSTAYNSSPTATTNDGRPTITGAGKMGVVRATFTLAIPAATPIVANDVMKLAPIPLNYKVTGWFLDIPILDNSGGVVESLGDNTNSAGVYAAGMTGGRSGAASFHRTGDAGTVNGVIASALASYQAKHASRVNDDAADDFMLKITTAPTSTQTGTVKTFYGWVDLEPCNENDDQ